MARVFDFKEDTVPPVSGPKRFPQISLVVYHGDGAEIVTLVAGARLLIGRAREADISIPEPTLSRHHARIELVGNDVWLEDLDSSNGTRINGKEIQRGKLRPGDDVSLGSMVTLSIHTSAHYAQGLEHHGHFIKNLEEELVRTKTFNHHLSVLLFGSAREEALPFNLWSPQILQLLRPVDHAALHSHGLVEVLMPETDSPTATHLAQRIGQLIPSLHCGIASFPSHLASAEALIETALRSLRACSEGQPITIASQSTPLNRAASSPLLVLGERMQTVYETVERVSDSDLPVLIIGETGVGKELVARAIHQASPRRDRPLQCINCGAILRDLVLSTLFGHEKGAFTGAIQKRKGVLEEAHGSSLLLDEVGELSPEAQVALLRVLETGRLTRIGSNQEIAVNVRIISATNRNLEAMCEAGSFRWDLYYRLNPITIKVPALRQRRDEIKLLAKHFITRASHLTGHQAQTLAEETIAALERYQWPGNIRELRNAMERAILVAQGETITVADLPTHLRIATHEELHDERGQSLVQKGDPTPIWGSQQVEESVFRRKVQSYEIVLIRRALERTSWNKTAAAQELQMPLRTLMYKVSVYGLKKPITSSDDTIKSLTALSDADEPQDFKTCIQHYEKQLLSTAITEARGNKAVAARRLGLSLSTMLYKVKSYQLGA